MSAEGALAEAVGHPAPFTDAELAALRTLTVTGARDLEALRRCTGLRRLRIFAAELRDLDVLEELTALTHLELAGCRIGDPRGWSGCERVDLVFTVIEDVPVELFCWPRGHVVGLPHAEDGRDFPLTEVPDADTMTEHERRQAVGYWQRDGLLPGAVAGVGPVLVRPGLTARTDIYEMSNKSGRLRLDLFGEAATDHSAGTDHGRGADVAERFLRRRFTDDERELRWWLAGATGDLFDVATEASIGHFAQRFPHLLRLPVDVPGAPYRGALPEPNWLLEQRLTLWTILRDCPPVRAGAAMYRIGIPEPGELDLFAATGLLVVGRAVDRPGRLLVVVATGDSEFRLYHVDGPAYLAALADRRPAEGDDPAPEPDPDVGRVAELAGPRAAALLTRAFDSFGDLLDAVVQVGAPAASTPTEALAAEVGPSLLHPAVRRQLLRLRAERGTVRGEFQVETPAGPRAVPPAVRELMAHDFPAGWSARLEDPEWAVRWSRIDIEPGILREARAWFGIALVEEGQYFWVVDLDDDGDDPRVYRVDHDDWDHVPYGDRLSGLLADLSLVNDEAG